MIVILPAEELLSANEDVSETIVNKHPGCRSVIFLLRGVGERWVEQGQVIAITEGVRVWCSDMRTEAKTTGSVLSA